ncbi:unnamed protein product, partial [Prorocentrum cordatum]
VILDPVIHIHVYLTTSMAVRMFAALLGLFVSACHGLLTQPVEGGFDESGFDESGFDEEQQLASDNGSWPGLPKLKFHKPHLRRHEEHAADAAGAGAYRQRLRNLQDIQYFGEVKVGNQTLEGLFDTGSFELLVFGEGCTTCGSSGVYKHSLSSSFTAGGRKETHSFGSGTCYSDEGYETVSLGPFSVERLPFWEVVSAQMPVLDSQQSGFQAIVGIGPPGEPAATAQAELDDLAKREEWHLRHDGAVPEQLQREKEDMLQKLDSEKKKVAFLQALGVSTFSSCLDRMSGGSGWMVWNDNSALRDPQNFMSLPVAGTLTWSLQITGMGLKGFGPTADNPIGCQGGCGAIVDTGTSLLAVPSDIYQRLYDLIKGMEMDCNDLRKFPDIYITVNGHELLLPPDSYIGRVVGNVPKFMKKHVHASADVAEFSQDDALNPNAVQLDRFRARQRVRRQKCQLLLMDMGNQVTQLGPLMILGMPFFREYYTSFNLTDRSIRVAPADDQCRPQGAVTSLMVTRSHVPRKVDVATLRPPRWLSRNDTVVLTI